jgi:hypothetical protein
MEPNLTPGQLAHFTWRIEDTLRPEFIDSQFTERRDITEISSCADLKSEILSLALDLLTYELEALAELSRDDFERLFSRAVDQALKVTERRFPEIMAQIGETLSQWFPAMKERAYTLFTECSSDEISVDFEENYFRASLAVRRTRHIGITETDRDDFVDSVERWFLSKMEHYYNSELESSRYNFQEKLEGARGLVRFKARMEITLLGVLPKRAKEFSKEVMERQFSATFESLGIFGEEGDVLRNEIERHIASQIAKLIHSKNGGHEFFSQ